MKRLTTDTPKDNIENALNLFYIKGQWTWVRGGGPAPDYADVSLCDFVRMLVKANIPDATLPENDDDLSMMMAEWLMDEPDSAEGIISLLYTAGWAFAELRHRLATYEDTGLEPEEAKDMAENAETRLLTWCESRYGFPVGTVMDLLEAKRQGRLVVLPCKVGDTVYKIDTDPQLDSREILELTVDNFVVCEDGGILVKYDSWDGVICTADNLVNGTAYLDYYRVFLTREEAEEALRKEGEEVENRNTESV